MGGLFSRKRGAPQIIEVEKVIERTEVKIEYVADPKLTAELERLNVELDRLKKDAEKSKDPSFFNENIKKIADYHLKQLPKMKISQSIIKSIGEIHVAFLGPVTAGKSTAINTIHGTDAAVAMGECTSEPALEVTRVDRDGNMYNCWDVPGANNDFAYFKIENYQFIASLDICVVMFDSDVSVVSWILRAVYGINPRSLVVVRTKCDQYDEDSDRTIEEERILDEKKVEDLLGEKYHVYYISSRNVAKKRGDLFDWNDFVDVIYPSRFREFDPRYNHGSHLLTDTSAVACASSS